MAERGGARGRAAVWRPWAAGGSGPAWAWPDGAADFARRLAQRIRTWALVEVGPGRLVPWLAIAFGSGIVVYFSVDREPAPWAAAALMVATVAVTVLVRRRPIAFPLVLGAAAMAAGFATATFKRALIDHPVLAAPAWNVEIGGFVEIREERERSDRITVRVDRIAGPRLNEQLERVRVSVRKGTAPAVGSFVEFKARLSPPLEPLRPGGYDFARDMYFQRIGASGFVLGRIRTTEAPHAGTLWLRYATVIDGMREGIDKRIRAVLPGDKGAIASALITGKRDAISAPVNEAMYASSLAHVLSISGYPVPCFPQKDAEGRRSPQNRPDLALSTCRMLAQARSGTQNGLSPTLPGQALKSWEADHAAYDRRRARTDTAPRQARSHRVG
jgi:competence protein ComEC